MFKDNDIKTFKAINKNDNLTYDLYQIEKDDVIEGLGDYSVGDYLVFKNSECISYIKKSTLKFNYLIV